MTQDPNVKLKRAQKKPPGRFHHGDLREAALTEAFRIVDKQGSEALSVRALAQKLGVSDPAIYRHYQSREALLVEVARRGATGHMQALADAFTLEDEPLVALEACGRAYVTFACEHRGWFRLCFSAALQDAGLYDMEHAKELLMTAGKAEAHIKQQLRRVVPDHLVDDQYRAFWGLVHGLSSLVIERVFRRVETDAERQEVAFKAIALHVAAVCGKSRG
jgi:AcrR family transcriptional regulator